MMTERQADALADFLRSHGGNLTARARQLTGNKPDADDLVQDTALRLADSWENFDGKRSPLPWAMTIMGNVWKDERKSARRRLTVSIDSADPDTEQTLHDMLAHPEPGPELLAKLADLRAYVNALGVVLKPHQWKILKSLGLEAHKYRQAGERAGIPIGTVRSRAHRAARRAKALIGQDPR